MAFVSRATRCPKRRRSVWIPPVPLVSGVLFQMASWALLAAYGFAPSMGLALAWVHAVALGWLTLVALAVLVHVVPGMTELPWRSEPVVRATIPIAIAGAAALVISFAAGWGTGVALAGSLVALAILAYLAFALPTLAQGAPGKTEAAIARALAICLGTLGLTVLLGAALAHGYSSPRAANWLRLAPAHAVLGIVGWLTVLTTGVSARTFRPLLGVRSRWPQAHVVSDGGFVLAALLGAAASLIGAPLFAAAALAGALSALIYIVDAIDTLRRATTPHRPVHAFIGASVFWLGAASVAAVAGAYPAAILLGLAGWLGQMVNAHLHHIGVRVVATVFAGEDDETRPWELLDARLSWFAWAAAQCAVGGAALGLVSGYAPAFIAGGCCGILAVCAMAANAFGAGRRARALAQCRVEPATISRLAQPAVSAEN
jgi:hypothetical protein